MSVARRLLWLCWRNRVLIPLFLLAGVIGLSLIILRDASLEYRSGGKIRLSYKLPATRDSQNDIRDIPRVQRPMLAPAWNHKRATFMIHNHQDDNEEVELLWNNEDPRINFVEEAEEKQVEKELEGLLRRDDEAAAAHDHLRRDGKPLEGNLSVGNPDTKQGQPLVRKRRRKHKLKFAPVWSNIPYYNASDPPEIFKTWRLYEDHFCENSLEGYFNEFAHLKNVVLDRRQCISKRRGGEKLSAVMNQPEEDEYYTYQQGCFRLQCESKPSYYFNNNNHLNDWLYTMTTTQTAPPQNIPVKKDFFIAVVRYEYVNFYHSMSDWYNAFLLMQFYNKTQRDTNILLVDAHPQGSLDSTWLVLYNTTRRISMLPNETLFTNLIWNIIGYNSPLLDHYGPGLPLAEEFRSFILTSFAVKDAHQLDCDKLNILFIWRRDYVAHPRNPTGSVSRKVFNEQELVKSVQERYPLFQVRGVQIDLFDMRKQLALVANTDVIIGMHGAGLTHALFLPQHGGMVELIPIYWSAANEHFLAISQWRKLHYERWVNEDPHNEIEDNFTKVPPDMLLALLQNVIKNMCYNSTTSPTT